MHDTTELVTENIRRPTKEKQVAKEQHGIAGHCVKWAARRSIMVEQVQVDKLQRRNHTKMKEERPSQQQKQPRNNTALPFIV